MPSVGRIPLGMSVLSHIMASKDPLNPEDMRTVYISGVPSSTYRPAIRIERTYLAGTQRPDVAAIFYVHRNNIAFTVQPPATVIGLCSPQSQYVKAAHEAVMWKGPFGHEL
jgi:hypothetical protein